jgi:hypothetical protein
MYRQFKYANYEVASYKYTTQLGVILKREYPTCVLQDRDEDGILIRERPALDWPDYFLGPEDKDGRTNGDRVLYDFWVRGMFGSFSFIANTLPCLVHFHSNGNESLM